MLSNCAEYYRFAAYLLHYTEELMCVVLGLPTLKELFEEKYYSKLEGGILESFGRMFKNDLRLYVYTSRGEKCSVSAVENLEVQEHLRELYDCLGGNRFIRPIDDYNEDYLSIFSRAALVKLRAGDPEWEAMVPERVATIIKERGLLGLKLLAS